MITHTIIQICEVVLDVVWWIIFAQFVVSLLLVFNVVNTSNGFVRSLATGLDRTTEPLYRPIRRVVPTLGGIDWSPMIVLVIIRILNIVLANADISLLTGGAV